MTQLEHTFGRFQLLRRIATGGMADIFLGRTASIDGFEKIVIVKRIHAKLSGDPRFFSMFIDETRIVNALSHPNIVEVFDFGKADDCYYLAMEYVSGCDLGVLLALRQVESGGLDPGLSLFVIREVCEALDYAHRVARRGGKPLNVVHRDVSPANILLSLHGKVKLTDFGVAQAGDDVNRSGPKALVGKLPYMSPEQARGLALDHRSDVFSAGLVLWELLVGVPAHLSDSSAPDLKRIQKPRLPPPSRYNPRLPAELDALVAGALAPNPKGRYPTARAFQEQLDAHLQSNYPHVGEHSLQQFLQSNREELAEILAELGDARGASPGSAESRATSSKVDETPRPGAGAVVALTTQSPWSEEVTLAARSFCAHPNLWTLVEMARRLQQQSEAQAALCFYRAAAVKFARARLFAQALVCCKGMLRVRPIEDLREEFRSLYELPRASEADVESLLFRDPGPAEDLLRGMLAATSPASAGQVDETALLSYIGADAFAELAGAVSLKRFDEGENIVVEGQQGDTMYLIGEGRILISAAGSTHRRIYLSSLTAGDFFGENSFFTGTPRSATVQALSRTAVFEIDPALYDRVMEERPDAKAILIRFYKQRIADTLIAKSRILGTLPRSKRKALVDKLTLRIFEPGDYLIVEGAVARQIFLLKEGHAEVVTEKGGELTHLSDIGPGAIVGEIASFRGIPRTASIRAKTRLEVLELTGEHFAQVIASSPGVRAKILGIIADRARQNLDKIALFDGWGGPDNK